MLAVNPLNRITQIEEEPFSCSATLGAPTAIAVTRNGHALRAAMTAFGKTKP